MPWQGQFYEDLVSVVEELANAVSCRPLSPRRRGLAAASAVGAQGKIVIVAALDGTFQRKPFGAPSFRAARLLLRVRALGCACGRARAGARSHGGESLQAECRVHVVPVLGLLYHAVRARAGACAARTVVLCSQFGLGDGGTAYRRCRPLHCHVPVVLPGATAVSARRAACLCVRARLRQT